MNDNTQHKVLIGDEKLDFQPMEIEKSNPSGKDIIDAAGYSPAEEHLIFSISPENQLREIYLNDSVDLTMFAEPRFLVFKSDGSKNFILNDEKIEWGSNLIHGYTLKKLSGKESEDYFVWKISKDASKEIITNEQIVDLSAPDVEKFETTSAFKIKIEGTEHKWPTKIITAEKIAELGNWDISEGVVVIDRDNNQRQLDPGKPVEISSDHQYGKKIKFQRGRLPIEFKPRVERLNFDLQNDSGLYLEA